MSGIKPLRVAVVGCGWYAPNHAHSWRALASDGAELVGVADVDGDKAARAGAEFQVSAFSDAGQLIDALRPDLIDIVTTVGSHRELVTLAARRRIGAIVQKPMARNWDECLAMADDVRRAGIFFGVHENFRFQAAIMRVRRLLRNEAIGAPSFARITFRTTFDTTEFQPYLREEKRFILMDVGVHILDLARHMMGEVVRLSCETQSRRPGLAGEDTATMMLRHESGAVSVVDCSFAAHRILDSFPETMIELEGELGCLRLSEGGVIEVKSRGIVWRENASAPLLPWTERPLHVAQESVLSFNRHIIEAWRAGRQPDTDLGDSLRTFALVDAAYRSAEAHAVVTPEIACDSPLPSV